MSFLVGKVYSIEPRPQSIYEIEDNQRQAKEYIAKNPGVTKKRSHKIYTYSPSKYANAKYSHKAPANHPWRPSRMYV